jgi:isoaspartyl peptidase/L-asparaginase-like protein (Ntn-hydrolase superfamily)
MTPIKEKSTHPRRLTTTSWPTRQGSQVAPSNWGGRLGWAHYDAAAMALHLDTAQLGLPGIVIHGGAGTFSIISGADDVARLEKTLERAVAAGWEVLISGGDALSAVVEAVAALEGSGVFNAGRGAVPTTEGTVEFDASVMDSATKKVGALCAVTYPANPVRAARALAERGGVPGGPILLAGEGGDRFCREVGLEEMDPGWLTAKKPPAGATSEEGTVGAVAVDERGQLAAATSTGGRSGQWPGRVGDTPIPGAGILAEADKVAVSATGDGEAFMVAGFAHRISWDLERGAGLGAALAAGLGAVGDLGGTGGGICLGPSGEMAAGFSTPAMARSWRGKDQAQTAIYPS